MHEIDAPGATQDGDFQEGDPATGVEPTEVDAEWLTAVQREIINAVEAAGLTLDKADKTQLLQAIVIGLATRIVRGDVSVGILNGEGQVRVTQANTGAPGKLNIISGGALHNAVLKLTAGGGASEGWELVNAASAGQLVFQFATDAAPDGTGTYVNKAFLREDGNFFSGLFYDPSGFASLGNGLILQWGKVTTPLAEGSVVINLPMAFPNQCLHAGAIGRNNTGASNKGSWVESESVDQAQLKFYVQYSGAGSATIDGLRWFAIGR